MKSSLLFYFFSLVIVALGQPARIGELGAIAACSGFALFFLSLPERLSGWQRFAAGTLWFFVVQLIQLSWMATIEFQGIYIIFVHILLSFALGLQFGVFTYFFPKRGTLSFIQIGALSGLWTLLEWSRLFPFCGLSFNPIGLSLTHDVRSLQFASVFGILGLSFWVMLTNLCALNSARRYTIRSFVYFAAVGLTPYIFGWLSMTEIQDSHSLRVAIVQTDLLPSEKVLTYEREKDFITPHMQWKTIVELLKREKREWDLLIFPEAMVPYSSDVPLYRFEDVRSYFLSQFGEISLDALPPLQLPFAAMKEVYGRKELCASNLFWCQMLANLFRSDVIVGLDHQEKSEGKNYNSAFYVQSGNKAVQRYDKQVLLPMGEYLPFAFLQPLVKDYGISDFFSPGIAANIFKGKFRYAPSICYEDTLSSLLQTTMREGPDVFVNLTNDNYFPRSSLHAQHLFHARVRAVENGLPLVRSCNAGISAIIDSQGRIQQAPDTKLRIFSGSLPLHKKKTLYAYWGNAGIIALCLGLVFSYCIVLMRNPIASSDFPIL